MDGSIYNIPAEKSLLTIVLRQPDYVVELGLTALDFYPTHSRVWTAIQTAHREGRAVTDVELYAVAPDQLVKELLYANIMPNGLARDYVYLIQQKSEARRMQKLAIDVHGIATSNQVAPTDKFSMVSQMYVQFLRESLIDENGNDGYMKSVYLDFEQEYAGKYFRAIYTGINELDNKLVIGKTGIYTFAGRPGVGKTQFFISWLWNAKNINLRSIYGTVEVQAEALAKRIINTKVMINPLWMALNKHPMTASQITAHREAVSLYESHFDKDKRDPRLKIVYGTYFEDFVNKVHQHHYRNPVNVVFLDHISMMRLRTFSGKPSDRHREVADMMGQLNSLTIELGVPICMASQLNRGVESRAVKEPVLADLKESSSIEEVSHTTTFLYPDPQMDEEDFENSSARPLIYKIAKSRTGETGRGGLQFNANAGTYQERTLTGKRKD